MERESLRLWTGWAAAIGAAAVATTAPVAAQEAVLGAEALAKQLANPIASLISVPLQSNWDRNIGPLEAGRRYTLNVQPVIPVSLSTDWNLINRVILPIIDQSDVFPGAGSQFGFGDTVASFFLSPKQPTAGGWIWGAGPVALLPTGTDDLLGTGRWALGPTGVALRQAGSWTYGALANHLWSLGGSSGRADVNSTFLQPFFAYTTGNAWSFTLLAEATYDWEREDESIPFAFMVGKVFSLGGQAMQLSAGPRYYARNFDNGPKGWGARLSFVLLFPR